MHLILIPESLNRAPAQSLLYRKIHAFLAEEQLEDQFAIAVMKFRGKIEVTSLRQGYGRQAEGTGGTDVRKERKRVKFVPKNTKRSWVNEAQIQRMARRYAEFLSKHYPPTDLPSYSPIIVYARGAYLQAMRRASVLSGVPIREVLSETDLVKLRRKGMAWMKVGLRLKDAWMRLEETVREVGKNSECKIQNAEFKKSDLTFIAKTTGICPTCGTLLQKAHRKKRVCAE